jgi:hypothetical protein
MRARWLTALRLRSSQRPEIWWDLSSGSGRERPDLLAPQLRLASGNCGNHDDFSRTVTNLVDNAVRDGTTFAVRLTGSDDKRHDSPRR